MKIKREIFISTLLFLLVFSVYIYSACRVNSGYADSDEIVTAGYLLSVAHPPGYPLQVIFTKLFTLLPIDGSVAFRANLLSGFFGALTIMMVYVVGRKVVQYSEKSKEVMSYLLVDIVSVTGALLLAFSSHFWLYSAVAEVFALNNFLVILGVWLGLKWYEEIIQNSKLKAQNKNLKFGNKKEEALVKTKVITGMTSKKEILYFILTCVVVGVGLSHVQTYVLFLPGFLWLFFNTIKKSHKNIIIENFGSFLIKRIIVGFVTILLSFILVNSLLFWFNSRKQNFSWYFPQNIKGWYQEITRWVYTEYDLERGEASSAYFAGFSWDKLKAIPVYFKFLNEHFAGLGLILGILGIGWMVKNVNLRKYEYKNIKKKNLNLKYNNFGLGMTFFLIGLYLFGGVFLGAYAGYFQEKPENLFFRTNVALLQRQYLQGEVIWSIFVIYGLWFLLSSIKYGNSQNQKLKVKASRKEKIGNERMWIGIVFCSLLVGWMVFSNYNIGIQRDTSISYDYAKQVLDSAEKDSAIICLYDFPCFSMIYLQEVEGYRKDVKVLPRNRFFKYYFFERNPDYYAYNYLDHKDYASALVYWNLSERTTYTTDLTPGSFNFGMYDGTVFAVPSGYLFKITKKVPEKIENYDFKLSKAYLKKKIDKKNYWLAGIGDFLANIHMQQAKQYAYLWEKDKAMESIFLAQQLNKDYVTVKNLINQISMYQGNVAYKKENESLSAEAFLTFAREKEKEGNNKQAMASYLRGTFVEPRNKQTRLALAEFYLKNGGMREGFEEYRRLNLMFPEDKEIEKILNELRERLGIKS